jgi:strictosidine synthase
MRRIVWRLPESFLPQPMNRGFVVLLDAAGGVDDVMQDPAGRYAQITSVERVGNHLYFGSLVETSVGRIAVP